MAKASHSPRSSLADGGRREEYYETTISSTSSSWPDLTAFFNSLLGDTRQSTKPRVRPLTPRLAWCLASATPSHVPNWLASACGGDARERGTLRRWHNC